MFPRYLPLRIEHNQDESYTVVNRINSQSLPELERLFELCIHLYERLECASSTIRATFQQIAVNIRHYQSLLMEEIERLDATGVKIRVGTKGRDQILKKFAKLEKQVPDWNHQSVSFNMFHGVQSKWDYATSKLFIVLPADLSSWKDSEPSTHHFRLYFLCENRKDEVTPKTMPQQVHLSNHPGYNLLRPQEFFEEYGDYLLRVLRMVKNGYTIGFYEIPPMDPSKILWKCDPNITGSHLSKDTIASLVDKTIGYLQELSPLEWIMEPGLTRSQSAVIKEFLDVQEGENTEGNLHRYIDSDQRVSWRCHPHKQQYFDQKKLEALKIFINEHGGHVDMQQTMLRVVLQSSTVADQFTTLVRGTQQIFNLNLKLNWKAQRSSLRDLCIDLARSKAVVLDVDGVTLESHPQGYVHYALNLFADKVIPDSGLQLITLVNYPRSQEQCLHLGKFSLQTKISTSLPSRSWVELKNDLENFNNLVSLARTTPDCDRAAKTLQSVLEKHGYPKATVVTVYESGWKTVFNPEEGGVVEVYSQDAACPMGVHSSGSLRKLTVDLSELEFDQDFFHIVQSNASLQELNVSYRGHNVLYYIESIVRMWHESLSPFRLTLIDRMEDTRGRVVAQMNIRGCGSDRSGDSTLEVDRVDSTSSSTQKDEPNAPTDIQFSHWDCDHISSKLSDYSASIIDSATEQHPSALNSLSLDTSQLSHEGLVSAGKVLSQSHLDYLNVVCTPFDPKLSGHIAQVLDSVQLDSLKSLVLSGSNIDGWIKLWPTRDAPQLIHIGIRGTGDPRQELSHKSVLALHQLVYASPLIDLKFENVELQHKRDWDLLVGAMDPQSLKTFGLCERSKAQFMSCPEAVDHFNAKFQNPEEKTEEKSSAMIPVVEDVVEEQPKLSFWRRLCCCCGSGRKN